MRGLCAEPQKARRKTMAKNPKTPVSGETLFVPLNRLKKSPKNARKTPHTKAEIETLATSIAAKGLLQNLVVEPERDKRSRPTGYYLVTIGEGRRLAQLLRVKRKEIAKDEPVRCVLDTEHNAFEISLAENVIRSNMHPADQFEAFAKLHNEEGMSAEDIAARFGVTTAVVKQRLKLGAVSPKLMKLYREGELNLDQLTAFAITDDHAAQERVWSELSWDKSRATILRILSEGQVPSDDRRAVFVGAKVYQAAGGVVVRDLFDEEGGGFFADAALLNRLVREKLQTEAQQLLGEGWKWVAVEPEFDHELTSGMRRVYPEPVPLSADEHAKLDTLQARFDELVESGEESSEVSAELDRLQGEIEALTEREQYNAEDIARAGAFISLGHNGEPRIERGFVRKEDDEDDAVTAESDAEKTGPDGAAPFSERLMAELTAYRTAGLRNALAQRPEVALLALVHALVLSAFYTGDEASCLQVRLVHAPLATHAPGIDESPAGRAIIARHEAWERRLPPKSEQSWQFLAALPDSERLSLLAHCVSLSVNALRVLGHHPQIGVDAHAATLAQAVALDMTAVWKPTAPGYFGRVSKDRILEAVREGVSAQAAENIASLKKAAMAEAAEKLLEASGWLPSVLRSPEAVHVAAEPLPIAAE
jgi:ParB family transcriptional regulator, chromosome partitioning protein